MCTNFTDMNKCYLKDDFPLVRIDKIVDSAAGYEIMALLDFFRLPPNMASQRGRRKDEFYNTLQHILVSENARRTAQRKSHFLQNDEGSIKRPSW
jgi:hypothetical protein